MKNYTVSAAFCNIDVHREIWWPSRRFACSQRVDLTRVAEYAGKYGQDPLELWEQREALPFLSKAGADAASAYAGMTTQQILEKARETSLAKYHGQLRRGWRMNGQKHGFNFELPVFDDRDLEIEH